MGAQAAYPVVVSVGGAPVAFADEATTRVTANTVYQVTDATKQRLDPATAVVVEVDADGAGAGAYVEADPDTYEVDYLFGRVTFSDDQGSDALVRVSGKYIPVFPVGNAQSATTEFSNDVVDLNIFVEDGYRRREVALADFSGTLQGLDVPSVDLDAGADAVSLQALFDAGAPFLLEVVRGGAAPVFRAWVKLPELGHQLSAGALYQSNAKFVGHSFRGEGQTEYVAWGYAP